MSSLEDLAKFIIGALRYKELLTPSSGGSDSSDALDLTRLGQVLAEHKRGIRDLQLVSAEMLKAMPSTPAVPCGGFQDREAVLNVMPQIGYLPNVEGKNNNDDASGSKPPLRLQIKPSSTDCLESSTTAKSPYEVGRFDVSIYEVIGSRKLPCC